MVRAARSTTLPPRHVRAGGWLHEQLRLSAQGHLARRRVAERLAGLPAILSADHCAHQYFQLPNQIECTPGNRTFWVPHETDLLFGTATGYGCCAANLHMGWPRLAQHLWLRDADGLYAPLLAPSTATATLDGREVTIAEETVELIPFGAARLRISQFPTVG